ncbi:MAG TPA: transglycosylase, partial [Erythrobacter sp.]|nr:transglycosylase [Erythrobacter sp.]
YNAGPGRVIRAGGVPRIRETQLYVAAIMGRLSDHSRE